MTLCVCNEYKHEAESLYAWEDLPSLQSNEDTHTHKGGHVLLTELILSTLEIVGTDSCLIIWQIHVLTIVCV